MRKTLDTSLVSRGSSGMDGDLEARVTRLEADVSEIKDTLRRLEPMIVQLLGEMGEFRKEMAKTREDMARLDGRVSQLPTTWTLMVGVVAIISLVFGLLKLGL